MKKFLLVVPLLVLIVFLTGCTKYWYQEGKTYGECRRDLQQCAAEMSKFSDKDLNLGVYDISYERNCMKQRGYRLVKERSLPLRVRRQGPDSFAGTYGVAGPLDEVP
jgi:hypothetical protein